MWNFAFITIALLYFVKAEIQPIVQTENGKFLGRVNNLADNKIYYSFEGIRYAEPPTGENRFRSPKPYTKKWNDIYDATKSLDRCYQVGNSLALQQTIVGVEDCLYLNIYTPDINKDKDQLYPVVFYIHGGGYLFGSNDELGERLIMEHQNIVYVAINYRLGAFGFLSTGDLEISGNMGIKDQLMALKWIKNNIRAFNGNPNQILVTGFSAGASSVEILTLIPGIGKLISSAYALSGSAVSSWAINANPKMSTNEFSESLNCPKDKIFDCLKNKPATEIMETTKKFSESGYFVPVIESLEVPDAILTEHPKELLKKGRFDKVPYLSSYTAEDGGMFSAIMHRNKSEVIKAGKEEFIKSFSIYLNNNDDMKTEKYFSEMFDDFSKGNYDKLTRLFTREVFSDGIIESHRLRRTVDGSKSYAHIYDNPSSYGFGQYLANTTDISLGTVHGDDLLLMLIFDIGQNIPKRPDEVKYSNLFINMLRTFATTGKPQFGEIELPEISNKCKDMKYLRITKDKYFIDTFNN